jgi:acyl-CoA hydrolase
MFLFAFIYNEINESLATMKQTKWIHPHQVLAMVQSHMQIVVGMVACEPQVFLSQLHTIAHRVKDVTILNCLPLQSHPYFSDRQYHASFTVHSWFLSKPLRQAYDHGNIRYIPNHLHQAGVKWLATHAQPDLFIGTASMPNKAGKISLSLSNVYEKRMIQAAKIVVLEVNPHYPFTEGDGVIDMQDVDFLVQTNDPVVELKDEPIEEKDRLIGRFIAPLIPDGACLQLGIGGIPNAVAHELKHKKDLGVHTEMLTNGMLELYQAGAINNSKKRLHPGQIVCTFIAGNKALYDFVHLNPQVLMMDANYVNNPDIIKQNPNQISINSTIEIDLTGQCCSESIGSKPFSGTGGQADTAIGAVKSQGGKSFITLHSTAMVKDRLTGQTQEISKIVPFLKPGAVVSLSRNDVDYVVTEYGVAALRGMDTQTRARRLIEIAHPQFRQALILEAKKYNIITA